MAIKKGELWLALPGTAGLDGVVPAIIDTPQGSYNKHKCDPEPGIFSLLKVLPAGAFFAYNFGFELVSPLLP
jgi:hypothetical protein